MEFLRHFLMMKRKTAVLTASFSTVLLGGAYHFAQDEGSRRSAQFWWEVSPIYLQYRLVQWRNESSLLLLPPFRPFKLDDDEAQKEYSYLHRKHSARVRDMTYLMGGFYLKSAQVLSVHDDFVPPEYMEWVKDTQDKVPSGFKSPSEVKQFVAKMLKEELEKDFDDVFSSFDDDPLGTASIGQVHKAVLKDTGEVVAVKIQLPGIERCFRADIATILSFCRLALPQFVPQFSEVEKQFRTEFDFQGEARNLETIRELVLPHWNHAINIPKPHLDLCSRHLLVMEYLDGIKLVEGIRQQYKAVSDATGFPIEAIEKERVEAIKAGTYNFKTLSESHKEYEDTKTKLFWKDMFTSLNAFRLMNNWSPLSYVFGQRELYATPAPLDLSHILKLICDVHGFQIFHCGCFNGDPYLMYMAPQHPGNILLLKDGRLGLIDYGQVKHLEEKHRLLYAKLIVALNNDDREEVVRLYNKEMGVSTLSNDKDVLYRHAAFYHDRDTDDITGGLNMHLFLEKLESDDPVRSISEEYIMAGRMNMLLRSISKAFGLKVKMSDLWRPQAEDYLRKSKQIN